MKMVLHVVFKMLHLAIISLDTSYYFHFVLSCRFGIEMVACDQEDYSQEEDEIPLLEGFQWESLMDMSSQCATRKRSLSESSLAPAAIHPQLTQNEDLRLDLHGFSVSPTFSKGNKHDHCQQEVEMDHEEAKAQKGPHILSSATVKALQRSDSVIGDSSSGTEQYDNQGTGKRRRAAGVSKKNNVNDASDFTKVSTLIHNQNSSSFFSPVGCPECRDFQLGAQ